MSVPVGVTSKRKNPIKKATVLLPVARKEIHKQNEHKTASEIKVDAGVTSRKAGVTAAMLANVRTIGSRGTDCRRTDTGSTGNKCDGVCGNGLKGRIYNVAVNNKRIIRKVHAIRPKHIEFIVLNGADKYTIRCEKRKILENSAELSRIIMANPNNGQRGDTPYQIANVDKHDFELLVRFLETRFIKYRDHLHILRILEMADLFKCPDLIVHSIRELDLHMSSDTVIDIFRALWFYQGLEMTKKHQLLATVVMDYDIAVTSRKKSELNKGLQEQQKQRKKIEREHLCKRQRNQAQQGPNVSALALRTKCAPEDVHPIDLVSNRKLFSAEDYGVPLLHNALQLIDMHAELVLSRSQISELRFEEIEMIAKRERLQLRSEMTLFISLANWSSAECRRRNLDITDENRRRVLGPLCYTPRYALMSYAEFCRACFRVELLDKTEIIFITEIIQGKEIKDLTDEQYQLLRRFQTPRSKFARMPIHLSDRSNHKNYPRRMRIAAEHDNDDEDNCWDNAALDCVPIFGCIFD